MQYRISRQLAAQDAGAAVVDQHHVQLVGAVGLGALRAPRAGDEVRVDRQLLAGRGAHQQGSTTARSARRRDDALDAHQGHVQRGRRAESDALPSLVTMHSVPVSATPKLTPEMPMSAVR